MTERAQITGQVEGSFNHAVTRAGMASDYILVGDTDHTLFSVRGFVSSNEMMRTLAESGAAHVCIEMPAYLDNLAQRYQNGEIDRAEFLRNFERDFSLANPGEITVHDMAESIANTMDNAKQYGMRVHFVDPGLPLPTAEENALFKEALQAYEHATGEKVDYRSRESVDDAVNYIRNHGDLLPPEKMQALRDASQRLLNARLNDQNLYSNIQQATHGEKTAVIYGSRHDDLADRIKRDGHSALVVDIYDEGRAFYRQREQGAEKVVVNGEPDLVHVVDEDNTYVTDRATDAEKAGLTINQGSMPANGYFLGILPIDPPGPDPSFQHRYDP